jgi:hypothetical protein|tara:strand:- start:261 stop:635 length:375 start_codon:yes stop_codon:yes gene_type:complete
MTQKKDDPKIKIQFAPGAFDNFEGTQEELDEFIAEITAQAESGELLSKSVPIDLDAMVLEDPEMALTIANEIGMFDELDAETAELLLKVMDELQAAKSSSILGDHDGVLDDNLLDNLIKNRRLN